MRLTACLLELDCLHWPLELDGNNGGPNNTVCEQEPEHWQRRRDRMRETRKEGTITRMDLTERDAWLETERKGRWKGRGRITTLITPRHSTLPAPVRLPALQQTTLLGGPIWYHPYNSPPSLASISVPNSTQFSNHSVQKETLFFHQPACPLFSTAQGALFKLFESHPVDPDAAAVIEISACLIYFL